MKIRQTLARLHIWLGWIIGVPLLFWTVSGLWMVARPIDEVRGTALRAGPVAFLADAPLAPPQTGQRAIKLLMIERQADGLRWLIDYQDGHSGRADVRTGALLPPVDAVLASAQARNAIKDPIKIADTRYFAANANPLDLRRERPAWQVRLANDTHVYIDAENGRLLAIRTAQWRAYDWMWGLHIMDLKGREETSHPLLIAAAGLGLISVLFGLILLPLTLRKRPTRS